MKAIGYFRISDISPSDQGVSGLQAQQEKNFHRFCREQGHEPAITFIDFDAKGKTSTTQYQQVLRFLRSQQGDLLVVLKAISDLNPDPLETVRCLLELDSMGAGVTVMDEVINDPLAVAVEAWSARHGDESVGERVREAMRVRAMHGKGMGKSPYGYRIGANQKLEIVPEEADTVILIYKLYLEQNMGVRLIARHLNEQGIPTKQGKRWSIVGVRDILRNRVYLGTYSRFGVKVPASHQAIVPDYVFKRVQEKLDTKSTKVQHAQRTPFLLAGMAYCGYCGNRMIGINRSQTWTRHRDGGRSTGTYRYYQCQSRTNQGICQYHTHKASDLENAVLATIRMHSTPQSREQIEAERPRVSEVSQEEPSSLAKKLKSLDRKLRGLLDQTASDDISLDEFRSRGREIVQQRQFMSQRLALLEAESRGEITAVQRRQFLTEELDKLQQQWDSLTLPAKKDLLQYVIDRIVVYDDRVDTSLRL